MLNSVRMLVPRGVALLLFVFASLSCEQFEYASPTPGIVEIRLAVKKISPELAIIPFSGLDSATGSQNTLGMTVRDIRITAPASYPEIIQLPLYASLEAIRRNPDGDIFNCLNLLARDSLLVLGIAYAPPGTFTGIEMELTPGPCLTGLGGQLGACVYVSYGAYGSQIGVVQMPPYQTYFVLPSAGGSLRIPVEEGRTTRVVVTLDLDRTLIRLEEEFAYYPTFYVSSVTIL
ncbi:MAG: hypothetical protein WB626_10030 [Bacteroidota bacterium]